MDNWSILGIHPTKDRDAIKQAYMTMLPKHNPEDDPEGFLQLRTAYEETLKSIEPEQEKAETPHTLFIKEVEEVYGDFAKRCNLKIWKTLLKKEVCQRLDMVDEAEHLLLQFLLNHFYLPMAVWAALSLHFDWPNRAESLKQNFPPTFIDYMLRKSTEPEHPRYSLFPTGKNAILPDDQWINLFLEVDTMITAGQQENPVFKEKFEKLESLHISHPYCVVILARLEVVKSNFAQALEILDPLYKAHPEDTHIWFAYTSVLSFLNREEEAITQFEKMLEQNPDFIDAKRGILNAQLKLKNYEAAESTMTKIFEINLYDYFALSCEQPIGEGLIAIYEEKYKSNPEDVDNLFALAKYLVKNQHVERCKELLAEVPHLSGDSRYKERLAMCAVIIGDWPTAAAIYEELIESDPKLYIYGNAASALNNMDEYQKALDYTDKALELYGTTAAKQDKTKLYIIKSQSAIELGRYNVAAQAVDEGLALNSKDPYLYTHKAKIYNVMNRFSEAMDYSEMALSIFPFMTDPYVLQMEIYHKQSMYDNVLAVAARAEAMGYESPKISCNKAEALRLLGEYDQALTIMKDLIDADFDEGHRDAIYTEMAQLMISTEDLDAAEVYINKAIEVGRYDLSRQTIFANIQREKEQYEEAKATLKDVLAKSPEYIPALIGMGHVFIDMDEIESGTMYLETAVKLAGHHEATYDSIVDIYMGAFLQEEALDWTIRRLNRFESLPNRIFVAIMHNRIGQKEMAESAYKKAIEMYPDASDGPRYYGLFLQNNRRHNEAILQFSRSVELAPTQLDLYETMAYCYQENKNYDQALAILDKAEAFFDNPQKPQEPYNLGALAMRRGTIYEDMLRHEEALASMLKAASLPDKLDGEWQLSWIYTRIGLQYSKNFNNATKAMEYYIKAIEDDENCIDAVDYMGDLYLYAHNDYEKAIECYNKKIAADPTDPHTYVTRALANTKLKRYAKAKKDYKQALELYEEKSIEDPSPCWQVYIANCKLGLKEVDAAKGMFMNGLNTPKEPGAWCNKPICDVCLYSLGKISEIEKNYDQALEYYERALEVSNSIKHNTARREIGAVNRE